METIQLNLTLYVVRSKDGKYFRSVGYGGYGKSWEENINKAKIYTKLGQARSRVTFWAKAYPEYGIPDIIEIVAGTGSIMTSEVKRVEKILEKAKKAKEEEELRREKQKLKDAERRVKEAEEKLNQLRKEQAKATFDQNLISFRRDVIALAALKYPGLKDCYIWTPKSKPGVHIFKDPNTWPADSWLDMAKMSETYGVPLFVLDLDKKPQAYAKSDGAPMPISTFITTTPISNLFQTGV